MKNGTYDIIGKTIRAVIISTPDRPVSMSDQSVIGGYLILDGDISVRIDVDEYVKR